MSNPFQDMESNPYAATATLETAAVPTQVGSYGGIGRLAYFGFTFALGIIQQVMSVAAAASLPQNMWGAAGLILIMVFFGATMWVVALRMINMGYSPWWCLAFMVPILNILVALRALMCPEGYADHKTLDTAGKVIAGIFLGFIALCVLLVFLASFSA